MNTFRIKFKSTCTITLEVLSRVASRLNPSATAINHTTEGTLYMDCDVDTSVWTLPGSDDPVPYTHQAQQAAVRLARIPEIMQIIEL